jgi:hypothetical protein
MTPAESFVSCRAASGLFELRDGGGVWIDHGPAPPSLMLPVPLLPAAFTSVVRLKTGAGDEWSNLDDSTGGKARSGFGEM